MHLYFNGCGRYMCFHTPYRLAYRPFRICPRHPTPLNTCIVRDFTATSHGKKTAMQQILSICRKKSGCCRSNGYSPGYFHGYFYGYSPGYFHGYFYGYSCEYYCEYSMRTHTLHEHIRLVNTYGILLWTKKRAPAVHCRSSLVKSRHRILRSRRCETVSRGLAPAGACKPSCRIKLKLAAKHCCGCLYWSGVQACSCPWP